MIKKLVILFITTTLIFSLVTPAYAEEGGLLDRERGKVNDVAVTDSVDLVVQQFKDIK